jgi:hypothetical protein
MVKTSRVFLTIAILFFVHFKVEANKVNSAANTLIEVLRVSDVILSLVAKANITVMHEDHRAYVSTAYECLEGIDKLTINNFFTEHLSANFPQQNIEIISLFFQKNRGKLLVEKIRKYDLKMEDLGEFEGGPIEFSLPTDPTGHLDTNMMSRLFSESGIYNDKATVPAIHFATFELYKCFKHRIGQ